MSDRFTATDALALDVEQVERWAREVVKDGDAPTDRLASLVVRLRTAADLLAGHLFQTSEPSTVRPEVEADADASAPRRAAPASVDEARGESERERAGSPKRLARGSRTPSGATPSGQPSKPSPPPVEREGAFHE